MNELYMNDQRMNTEDDPIDIYITSTKRKTLSRETSGRKTPPGIETISVEYDEENKVLLIIEPSKDICINMYTKDEAEQIWNQLTKDHEHEI